MLLCGTIIFPEFFVDTVELGDMELFGHPKFFQN